MKLWTYLRTEQGPQKKEFEFWVASLHFAPAVCIFFSFIKQRTTTSSEIRTFFIQNRKQATIVKNILMVHSADSLGLMSERLGIYVGRNQIDIIQTAH